MALIGEMKYLTIGDATYEIPSSGGSTSAGVTSLSTSAGSHTTVSNSTGAVTINVPTLPSHVGAAASSHHHGKITTDGTVTASSVSIVSGDSLVIIDQSDSSRVAKGLAFGSSTDTFLTNSGTWANVFSASTFSQTKDYSSTSERVSLSTGTTGKVVLSTTSTVNGLAFINGSIQFTASSSQNRDVSVVIDGVSVYQHRQQGSPSNTTVIGFSAVGQVSAGSTINIYAWQNSGGTLYAGGQLYVTYLKTSN